MSQGRHRAPRGRSKVAATSSNGVVANEDRLVALGQQVDTKQGVKRSPRTPRQRRSRRRKLAFGALGLVVVLLAVSFSGYLYGYITYGSVHKDKCPACHPISGPAFNVLEIGSDSRVGLTGPEARATGQGSVSGQRSDVIKIMHVDPTNQTITIISIPRDTMVALLANQNLYGNYNRINVNINNGPNLLVRTIEANFGIPISHTIEVGFGGLINAANAIGGVYLNFRYPAHDAWSGLNIQHSGCQLIRDFRALAVVRSRHYYYNVRGLSYWPPNYVNLTFPQLAAYGWIYDGTSDYGRIQRQDAFIRAMIVAAKGKWTDPSAIISLVNALPQGISVDSGLGYNELLGLAWTFHSFSPANLKTFTLPVTGAVVNSADVLIVNQPAAQQMLVSVFGHELTRPTNPPPNSSLRPNPPPVIAVTTTTSTTTTTLPAHSSTSSLPTTTTTIEPSTYASFNPVPCTPK